MPLTQSSVHVATNFKGGDHNYHHNCISQISRYFVQQNCDGHQKISIGSLLFLFYHDGFQEVIREQCTHLRDARLSCKLFDIRTDSGILHYLYLYPARDIFHYLYLYSARDIFTISICICIRLAKC